MLCSLRLLRTISSCNTFEGGETLCVSSIYYILTPHPPRSGKNAKHFESPSMFSKETRPSEAKFPRLIHQKRRLRSKLVKKCFSISNPPSRLIRQPLCDCHLPQRGRIFSPVGTYVEIYLGEGQSDQNLSGTVFYNSKVYQKSNTML